MEDALTVVLDHILYPEGIFKPTKFKPTTLLVMTNGDWDDDWGEEHPACGSETPIKKAVNLLNRWKRPRFDLSIQFIRFGHHAQGISRLEHLDNFLLKSR